MMKAMLLRSMSALAVLAMPVVTQAQASAQTQSLTLREGTQVHIATRDELTSKTSRQGDTVEMVVAQAVQVDGVTVIPAGARARGEVARAKGNGLLGKSGKLGIAVKEIDAGGRVISVRGQQNAKGGNGTVGAVGAGIVFLPLAIVVHGKEAKIPAGTTVDVYVDHDVPVILSDAGTPAEQPIVAPRPTGG